MTRSGQVRWRLPATLLALLLVFGAVGYGVAGADRNGPGDVHHTVSAAMAADPVGLPQTAGERDRSTRLVAGRGHGGALLFIVALSVLLAALHRPYRWAVAVAPTWPVPAAAGVSASRGRAPPTPHPA
ncbi:hypothetical protein ACNTMW_28610 [Planosporangium sp. 12N6]|uniref:hypothetical protein n=1 Tax=Planosporangium spinosum TaxID=3402278 RepID=UPI003CE75FC0